MSKLRKQFEKETNKSWWINPVCHGEYAYASWEYQCWLERQVLDKKASK